MGKGLLGEGANGLRATAIRFAWFAPALVIFFFLLDFPQPPTGRFLDTGWALALGHFMKTRQQAGVDYVFTYGPLGYLLVPVFVPGLYWLKYVWAIGFAAAASFVVTRLMRCMPSVLSRAAWFWLCLAVLPHSETLLILLLIGLPLLHVLEETWSVPHLAFTCALFSVLALAKFSFLVFGTATLAVLVIAAPRHERRRVAAWTSGLFAGFLLGLWVLAGQSLLHFPKFVSAGMEMVRGYTDAMAIDGSRVRASAALQTLVLVTLGLLIVRPSAWPSRRRLAGSALLAGGLFVAWKEGFVRQDTSHESVFFGVAAFLSLLAMALDPKDDSDERPLRIAFLATAALGCIGALKSATEDATSAFWTLQRWRELASYEGSILWSPREHLRNAQAVWRQEQAKWTLPEIRARVREEPIDVTSFDQTTMFWNGFNWRHRPAFQGYAAYTPELARRNAEFLTGPSAPRYILANWMTVDDRYPPEDDGSFLIELFRRYQPALSEREYILLERRAAGDEKYLNGSIVEERLVQFDEDIQLNIDPKNLVTMSVRVHRTLAGRIRHFLYRLPKIHVLIQLADGATRRFSIVPGLSTSEFVVSPFVEANVDFYPVSGGIGRQVVSVRLVTDADGEKCFGKSFEVTLRCYGERTSTCE